MTRRKGVERVGQGKKVDETSCCICGKRNRSTVKKTCGSQTCQEIHLTGRSPSRPVTGTQHAAMGHEFGDLLVCNYCGVDYYNHQAKPGLCRRLVEEKFVPEVKV